MRCSLVILAVVVSCFLTCCANLTVSRIPIYGETTSVSVADIQAVIAAFHPIGCETASISYIVVWNRDAMVIHIRCGNKKGPDYSAHRVKGKWEVSPLYMS
jgi:hypothetical protein